MNILAVDTAGKTAGVALLQDDRLLYECYLDAGMTHSETILPLIDNCLKFCHLTCADIDVYGVNAGPGSFTGLRIGLAAVKGLLCAIISTAKFPVCWPCRPLCGEAVPPPWHWWQSRWLGTGRPCCPRLCCRIITA